jgi:hypothetical protein
MPSVPPEPLGLPVTLGAHVLSLRPDVLLGAGIPLAMEALHRFLEPCRAGGLSPNPYTIRFDMVNTAVTKTRKYKARSFCAGGTRSPLGILGEHEGRDPLIGLVIG